MRAAVWTELNKIEVMDVERPSLGPNEVQIKVHATGMCITDLHVYTGQFAYGKPPHVLGHEIAGEICEVANPEHGYLLGTRVTVETSVGCGTCGFCRSGRPNLCPDMTEIGFTPHQGGYAEYVNVPVGNIVEIPDNVSYEEAGIIESIVCPMGALIRNQINFGETVAVFGVGPAGLAFIQGAKLLGAGKVIAIGRSDFPLQRAKNFGADILINTKTEDAEQRILAETAGMSVDLVCEAAGVPETIEKSFDIVRKAGRVILYGIPGDHDEIAFPVTKIVTNQLEVHGAVGEPTVWRPLLDMVADGRFDVKSMITHRVGLEDINQGFEILKTKKDYPVKVVVVHS